MNLCVIDADAKRHGHGNILLLLVLCVMASNIVDIVRNIILLLLHRRGRLLGLCIVIAICYCLYSFCCNVFVGYLLPPTKPNTICY